MPLVLGLAAVTSAAPGLLTARWLLLLGLALLGLPGSAEQAGKDPFQQSRFAAAVNSGMRGGLCRLGCGGSRFDRFDGRHFYAGFFVLLPAK